MLNKKDGLPFAFLNKTSEKTKEEKKKKSPEHFIELSEANRCDEDTACGGSRPFSRAGRDAEQNQTE